MRFTTKILAVTVALALPAVLMQACGDDTGTPPGSTGGNGGTGGSAGSAGVTCGQAGQCTTGHPCCVMAGAGGVMTMCATGATCPQGQGSIACDGPEDCGAGKCCGMFSIGNVSAACSNDAMCPQGQSQICH